MANLWRVLALSWLGGVASPALSGDMISGEVVGDTPTFSRSVEKAAFQDYSGMDKVSPGRGFRPGMGEHDFTQI